MTLEHQRFGALFVILICSMLSMGECYAQPMLPPNAELVPTPSGVKGSPKDILAEVSDIKITREMFDREIATYKQVANQQAAAQLSTLEGRQDFLDQLVEVTMFQKKAVLEGLDKTPEFKNDSRNGAIVALSMERMRKILDGVTVDEASSKKYYEDNKKNYTEPDQYHYFQISTDKKEKAEAIAKDINSGKSFIEIAKASSIDDTKDNGGDRGFVVLDDLAPEIASVLQNLKTDKISNPIAIADDLYVIVKYTEKKVGNVKSYDTVAAQIRREIASSKQIEVFKAEIDRLKKLYHFSFDSKAAETIRKESLTDAEKNTVLAKYDGGEIKVVDIYKDLEQIPSFIRPQVLGGEGLNDFLEQHFARVLSLVDAEKNYDAYMKENPRIADDIARRTLVKLLFDKVLGPDKVFVTENELKDYYIKNIANFASPAQTHAHHILVKDEQTAKDLLAKLEKDPTKFEEVAKASSTCPSKENGGDLGHFTDGQMVSEFEDACKKAEIGKVVGPVKTDFGYHLIRVDNRIPAGTMPFDKVQENIKKQLLPQKQKEVFDAYVESLRKEFNVKEYIENL